MSKYIIINADDFGLNKEQNAAIKDLLEKKLITSVSLMAVAPEAADAADFSREISIPTGVHITLNSDDSKDLYPSLTGAVSLGKTGLWHEGKNLTFKARRSDVRAELEAQYRYITEKGATVDHADSHCGTVYGINGRRFFLDAFDFCNEHKLPFRFPKTVGFLERQLGMKIPSPIVKLQQMIVSSAEKRNVKLLTDLVSNPWSMERIKDYDTLRKYYLDAVDNCLDGVTEIFLHPALPNDDYGNEWQKRELEYRLLKSGDLLQHAEDKGIRVVGWDIFES
ncbi:MAG: ChbG/HpnK family deacetylase [Ruminococcaceae bacterium]|nr:ChbG/HpnK family deacetylase [Oscillospiraceae bacterium]